MQHEAFFVQLGNEYKAVASQEHQEKIIDKINHFMNKPNQIFQGRPPVPFRIGKRELILKK